VDFDASLHSCVRQIRAALGDSAADTSYVENVPRRGYRLVFEDSRVPTDIEDRDRVAVSRRTRARLVAGVAVIIALAIASYVIGRQAISPAGVRIGIMPFQAPASMPRAQDWPPIAEWILEDLAASAGSSARIVGPTTTAAYEGTDIGLRKLADDYDLHYIVNGRFIDTEGGPRMLAELIRVSDGSHIWVRPYDYQKEGRLIGLEIGRNVARVLELSD
jgi:TolB-like protein